MAGPNSVWQDSDASLCNHLRCGNEEALCCLREVVGSRDWWWGRKGGREAGMLR